MRLGSTYSKIACSESIIDADLWVGYLVLSLDENSSILDNVIKRIPPEQRLKYIQNLSVFAQSSDSLGGFRWPSSEAIAYNQLIKYLEEISEIPYSDSQSSLLEILDENNVKGS